VIEAHEGSHQLMDVAHTKIRRAQTADAAEIARLAGELGYPMSVAGMTSMLAVLLANERHHVAVAANGERLCAWIHLEHRFSLEGERVEIMGLVVDATARRRGLGRALLDFAESWTRERNLSGLTVRSNVARELSHPFYESLGFTRSKTQQVYVKSVQSD
jgi:GNAT superfamily N-acetyltransferase